MQERYETLKQTLQTYDQAHLLHYFDELNDVSKARLLEQLEAQDWAQLSDLVQDLLNPAEVALSEDIQPAPYYPRTPSAELEETYRRAREHGEALLRAGKVAAFTVAGGQGTRLGWNGPKGTFPATPVQGKPLFQVFAEYILKASQKYGATVPWYLMTSSLNDADTRAFFERNDFFGLKSADVM
ncbi:MAG TPA: UTP--glucose-1-phosphate uridylyltransferase, partial [Chloroflexota bacterium]|nr:UTP--glucose-1-phosphate uridylyltransferase [Chloroflexota bacterium]